MKVTMLLPYMSPWPANLQDAQLVMQLSTADNHWPQRPIFMHREICLNNIYIALN